MVLLVVFVVVELRARSPLVPFSIFRLRNLRGGNIIGLLLGMALNSMFFLLALCLQRVLSFDALQAGLAFLPLALSIVLASIIASQLIERIGAKASLTTALVFITAALAWFDGVHADGSFPVDTLGPSILVGLGFGGSLVAVTTIATNGVPKKEAGLASGLINASQQVGGALGLSIIVSVAASVTTHNGGSGASALTAGYHAAFLVSAGIVLIGAILSVTLLTKNVNRDTSDTPTAPTSERTAALTTESDPIVTNTILITGATGDIGGKLVQLLQDSDADFRVMCPVAHAPLASIDW